LQTRAIFLTVLDGTDMFKKIISSFIDHPFLTSIFAADFFILLLHRPPFLFSLAMLGGLMAMCMYFGQKLSLFKD
jgi:hypothetical protein